VQNDYTIGNHVLKKGRTILVKAAIPALERYEVTLATREDAPAILNFLKEVASWVKHKNPQQWRDLLNGKLDDHIMDLI